MLEMQNISFRYGKDGPEILDDVSLSFGRGEFIALTGRNGSGKTTITRLLTGLEKPNAGRILYDGRDVTKEGAAGRSAFIGYVFQQPDRQMFMPTVREEVGFGPFQKGKRGAELDAIVDKAMAAADISEFADAYPRTLSRGDQQRTAIASALAMNTEYLVLDEPTSGQDGREKKRLCALMNDLREKGITILLVTHDMDIVAGEASRVLVLAGKKIAFDGSPEELFSEEHRPEEWGLSVPTSVRLGRALPGAPYCRDMKTFCDAYRKAGAGK